MPENEPDETPEVDQGTGSPAAAARMQNQAKYVDMVVRQAIERGEFDDLPGAGKPIKDLGAQHDPDWWLKQLIERENITGILPPSLQLRKDDAELDALLDKERVEDAARRRVEDFNARVIAARYGIPEGPPLITMPRDVDVTLAAWRERQAVRAEASRVRLAADAEAKAARRRWWPFGRG